MCSRGTLQSHPSSAWHGGEITDSEAEALLPSHREKQGSDGSLGMEGLWGVLDPGAAAARSGDDPWIFPFPSCLDSENEVRESH